MKKPKMQECFIDMVQTVAAFKYVFKYIFESACRFPVPSGSFPDGFVKQTIWCVMLKGKNGEIKCCLFVCW